MSQNTVSSQKNRTEQAILNAASKVWAYNRTASLPQIAEAAGVGRTTLHRYFPEREMLLKAAVQYSLQAINCSVVDAQPAMGTPSQALERVITALVANSELITFVFSGQSLSVQETSSKDEKTTDRDPIIELIKRGQTEGVFSKDVTSEWIQQVIWAIIYTAFEQVNKGAIDKYQLVTIIITTLQSGIYKHIDATNNIL